MQRGLGGGLQPTANRQPPIVLYFGIDILSTFRRMCTGPVRCSLWHLQVPIARRASAEAGAGNSENHRVLRARRALPR